MRGNQSGKKREIKTQKSSMTRSLRRIGCGLTCALMCATLVLAIVGTAGPQMYGAYGSDDDAMVGENWYLYGFKTTANERTESHGFSAENVPCGGMRHRYTAAFAFAILSCVGAAVAAGMSAYAWRVRGRSDNSPQTVRKRRHLPMSVVFWAVVANFALLTVAWPLSESVRSVGGCAGRAYAPADAGYRMGFGLAVLIAAWCVNGIAAVIAAIFQTR